MTLGKEERHAPVSVAIIHESKLCDEMNKKIARLDDLFIKIWRFRNKTLSLQPTKS